ncbi:MAG: cytochrome c oxidase accessory protein CcoG [Hyphomicrobiaceae bacterium]|nr:cytochrome c oxidase accessory protein CcoG [Hyphomicrobiaceae bacterium]
MSEPAAVQRNDEHITLFAEQENIHPLKVSGTFRKLKWFFLVNMLAAYYIAPFLRWDRGPNAPGQAILFDIPNRRFYMGPIEIWPQEVYYFTGVLMVASLLLFLTTAVAGRVWCGFWCPQTIWTDLFVMVERWIEGDRRKRIALDKAPWNFDKIRKRVLKHSVWIVISWWTGGALVLYFADAYQLVGGLTTDVTTFLGQIFSLQIPTMPVYITAWVWISIFAGTTYLLAGIAREQVCIYMCPWPRIQAALTDPEALNVTYRYDRGEPRGSVKKQQKVAATGAATGDCIDCNQCVWVCPTGTDIRLGMQLSCINCGLCIDACNNIMAKVGRPTGLIAFDTDLNIERRMKGDQNSFKPVRPRTLIYLVALLIAIGLMGWSLMNRTVTGINVLHDRNPLYVEEGDGSVMNGFTVRMLNMERKNRRFTLHVKGPDGAKITKVSEGMFVFKKSPEGLFIVNVKPDTTRELRVIVVLRAGKANVRSEPLTFFAKDLETGEQLSRSDFFKGPGQ